MVNNELDALDEIEVKTERIKRLKDSTDLWCIIAFLYYVTQNIYFFIVEGWHVKPLSDAEKLVDGIGTLLFFCAVFMFVRTVWRTVDLVITVVDLD